MSQDGYRVEVIGDFYCVICLKVMQNAVHVIIIHKPYF